MKIGELAQAADTAVETIRFYDREELLPEPARTQSNYRTYGPEHVERLVFIRHCRSLDMALDEVRSLLRFKDSPEDNCAGVNDLLDEHVRHVAERIRELRVLEKQLKALRDRCTEADAASSCGILMELSSDASPMPPRNPRHRHVHGTH
jgi:Cd(II)/Pb(II)-responsive transcriptional regulator